LHTESILSFPLTSRADKKGFFHIFQTEHYERCLETSVSESQARLGPLPLKPQFCKAKAPLQPKKLQDLAGFSPIDNQQ
jgi:hypothetical protein